MTFAELLNKVEEHGHQISVCREVLSFLDKLVSGQDASGTVDIPVEGDITKRVKAVHVASVRAAIASLEAELQHLHSTLMNSSIKLESE